MKFGKEFEAQMVQEWQQAYMDYNYLKSVLKDILRFKQQHAPSPVAATTEKVGLKRRASLYRAFSGLTSKYGRFNSQKDNQNEDEVILVTAAQEEGSYQTVFFKTGEDGGEYELVFFRRLDDEFNKVVKFYKEKVEEVMKEADELSQQMEALIALRIKVDKPVVGASVISLANYSASSDSGSVVNPINGRKVVFTQMEVIREVEMSNGSNSEDEINESMEQNVLNFTPAPIDVLDHVKINMKPATPVSTVKAMLKSSKSDPSFSKKELRKAEEVIMQAFVEFYQNLRLLKSYCFLNQLAFSKILKKYDKITSRSASRTYLQMVEKSCLGNSDEITKLMERVEANFVKHFANGNHRKGMDILRPKARRERHLITFFYGLFSGCSIALMIAIGVNIHARNILRSPRRQEYMENIFPLYSLFGYIVLHMLMYSGNVFFWKRYRVNYPFIFGFKQGTELGYREVLLLSTGLAVLALGGVISHLDMDIDPGTKRFRTITELIPLALLIIVLVITFCPFNIIYRSSRFFLITCVFHCICAPLYKVILPDFFLADQLTSQVQAFRSLEFYICYYGWGDFKSRKNTCSDSDVYKAFYLVVAIVPYWCRFIQCLRRLWDEKDSAHILNGMKYLSTITAVALRTIYELRKGRVLRVLAAASSGFATISNTYWDIVIDWGLLRRNSKNPWLRDKLVIENKSVYFAAMVMNVVLRLLWMQTVLDITDTPFLHRAALTALLAGLEIIRRGIWNFFRLENEHLNNVGKYRAFKSVPLPFSYEHHKD